MLNTAHILITSMSDRAINQLSNVAHLHHNRHAIVEPSSVNCAAQPGQGRLASRSATAQRGHHRPSNTHSKITSPNASTLYRAFAFTSTPCSASFSIGRRGPQRPGRSTFDKSTTAKSITPIASIIKGSAPIYEVSNVQTMKFTRKAPKERWVCEAMSSKTVLDSIAHGVNHTEAGPNVDDAGAHSCLADFVSTYQDTSGLSEISWSLRLDSRNSVMLPGSSHTPEHRKFSTMVSQAQRRATLRCVTPAKQPAADSNGALRPGGRSDINGLHNPLVAFNVSTNSTQSYQNRWQSRWECELSCPGFIDLRAVKAAGHHTSQSECDLRFKPALACFKLPHAVEENSMLALELICPGAGWKTNWCRDLQRTGVLASRVRFSDTIAIGLATKTHKRQGDHAVALFELHIQAHVTWAASANENTFVGKGTCFLISQRSENRQCPTLRHHLPAETLTIRL
ncbi:uncharacterized protein MYCGRDRAFT_97738 [Zymoseptoria tritici IPO323]|uniref:Uncharacterized protein n=1 Tax=Zymoseptoria tritici (strain CBS 115943 / IPO323) TaxID=336722 RepID=F9XR79_ZYMTI|nr:uncharacterized protein MYCGRDRAFT_97738 [Zymoseptoria tritici IPO323]EGP82258.1 hypothetical protein MYCGRDRAFT_97738 [Zymoseptoria tritici IPO323]